jgi:replicative DNA helicase
VTRRLHSIDGGGGREPSPGRVPPHNTDAERSLLGSMLYSAGSVAVALPLLSASDFYDTRHARLYSAIANVADTGQPVDPVTVLEQLRVSGHLDLMGGPVAFLEIQGAACVTSSAAAHAEIVARCAQGRRILTLAGELAENVYDHVDPATIAVKLKEQADALVGATNRRNRLFNAADLILDHIDTISERGDNEDSAAHGILLGWPELDDLLGGFKPGQLVVVAGRPGMGKSAVAAGMALRTAITNGMRVLTVSIEMSKEELMDRYVAAMSKVDLTKVRSGRLSPEEWKRTSAAADRFDGKNLWVLDDPTATLPAIHAAAQRVEADLVIVDYLQIVETLGGGKQKTREREVAELSGGLKRMARDLGVPVIALSQFNRGVEDRPSDKRPQLTDLRESGAIENDADAVIGLYRDDYYTKPVEPSNVLEMIVLKQRNGPTGVARLFFEAHTGRMGPLTLKGRN